MACVRPAAPTGSHVQRPAGGTRSGAERPLADAPAATRLAACSRAEPVPTGVPHRPARTAERRSSDWSRSRRGRGSARSAANPAYATRSRGCASFKSNRTACSGGERRRPPAAPGGSSAAGGRLTRTGARSSHRAPHRSAAPARHPRPRPGGRPATDAAACAGRAPRGEPVPGGRQVAVGGAGSRARSQRRPTMLLHTGWRGAFATPRSVASPRPTHFPTTPACR
jgi:hypothetical protein